MAWCFILSRKKSDFLSTVSFTLASGIDVGQRINVGPGKLGKKNKQNFQTSVENMVVCFF